MNPAALCAWGVAALVLMPAQAAPTDDSKKHKDIFEINQEAGLLGRACPGFKCDIDCDFGYDTDKDGCLVCSCISEGKEAMYQGDMVLDRQGKHRFLHGDSGNRAAIKQRHWPGGVVPYVIDQSIALGSRGRTAIAEAIADFHELTCLRFIPRTDEKAYIKFYTGGGCSSPVGYHGRVNAISLASGCWHKGIVIHEIMHTLGFFHEQSRPDRDDYVEILWDNIQGSMSYNFNKQAASKIDSLGTSYDYNSVMHYGKTAFGGGRVTIKTKDASKENVIGSRMGLSDIDKKQLNLLYKCGGSGSLVASSTASPTEAPSCEDKHTNCPSWRQHCSNSRYIAYMEEQCPKTCGTCGDGVSPTASSTASPTASPTVAPTASPTASPTAAPSCEDKHEYCPSFESYCSSSDSQTAAFMEENCPKTCGMCGRAASSTAAPTAAPSCEDKYTTCSSWESFCSNSRYIAFMEDRCPKTCGMCGGGAAPNAAHNAEAPCEDMHPKCPRMKRRCSKHPYTGKKFCPKTCGTCSGSGVVPAAARDAAPCEDKHPMCPQRKGHCGKRRVRKFCPKTCGKCARAI